LFTRAQRRRLWRRDRGCTYPGCTAPAAWSRAHHVLHWADGGPSDIDNAALLCQRHHSFVHTRRLWAEVRERPDEHGRYVVWDLTPGSYDRHLERLRAVRAVHDPPPLTPERLRADGSAHDPPPLTPDRLRELLTIVTAPGGEHPGGADAGEREWGWALDEADDALHDGGMPETDLDEAFSDDYYASVQRTA